MKNVTNQQEERIERRILIQILIVSLEMRLTVIRSKKLMKKKAEESMRVLLIPFLKKKCPKVSRPFCFHYLKGGVSKNLFNYSISICKIKIG